MDVFHAIETRRAVRAYTDQTVDKEVLQSLIETAVQAPSAMNRQPWAFAVVLGKPRLTELSHRIRPYLLQHLPKDSPLIQHLSDSQAEIFHGAPALVVICATDRERQSAEDCHLAGQNLMLAAHARGLGSCWIGLARDWLGLPEVKEELGIPAGYVPVAPIILGHRAEEPAPAPREAPRIVWCR